ncbi:MAG TPA: hypothetical protein HA286_02780 [Candidatus Poseidoniaceae archaeon]|nr:MAG TPA: hypothetical protein D7H96_02720 [Candidatus Poseidoniales archaeon]HIH53183.1 hypothetical protein [Candidatus Poseidoniaceae archaeon]
MKQNDEAWEAVNWDLDFGSFEWMVHLAACFNRHLPAGAPWTEWPGWSTDMPGWVQDKNRPGWLSALRLIHTHPRIAVKKSVVSVTSSHGITRELEDVDVSSRWWHVNVNIDWNVPRPLVAALDELHGPSPSHAFVPGQMEQLCLGVDDDSVSYGLGLSSVLQAMLDEVVLLSQATNFHAAKCRFCHETTYREGLRGQGFPPGKEVLFACGSCTGEPLTN